MAKKAKSYKVIETLTIGDDLVIAAGDVTDKIPAKSVGWLLEQGSIVEADVADVEDEGGR